MNGFEHAKFVIYTRCETKNRKTYTSKKYKYLVFKKVKKYSICMCMLASKREHKEVEYVHVYIYI